MCHGKEINDERVRERERGMEGERGGRMTVYFDTYSNRYRMYPKRTRRDRDRGRGIGATERRGEERRGERERERERERETKLERCLLSSLPLMSCRVYYLLNPWSPLDVECPKKMWRVDTLREMLVWEWWGILVQKGHGYGGWTSLRFVFEVRSCC